jgi:hypothetical protein
MPEVVTEADVATVTGWIAAARRGDDAATAELARVAEASGAAIPEHLRGQERASSSAALETFRESRRDRATRLEALLDEARRCVGLPLEAGTERLQSIAGRVLDVAQEVESARVSALATIGAVHERATASTSGGTAPDMPPEPEENA